MNELKPRLSWACTPLRLRSGLVVLRFRRNYLSREVCCAVQCVWDTCVYLRGALSITGLPHVVPFLFLSHCLLLFCFFLSSLLFWGFVSSHFVCFPVCSFSFLLPLLSFLLAPFCTRSLHTIFFSPYMLIASFFCPMYKHMYPCIYIYI